MFCSAGHAVATSSDSRVAGLAERTEGNPRDISSTTKLRSATVPALRPENPVSLQRRENYSMSSQDDIDPPIEVLLSNKSRSDLFGPTDTRQKHPQSGRSVYPSRVHRGVYDNVVRRNEEELSESNSSSLDDNEYENVKKEMKATAIQPHFYVNVPERSGRQLNKPSSVATAKQKQKKRYIGAATIGMHETRSALSGSDDDNPYDEVQM